MSFDREEAMVGLVTDRIQHRKEIIGDRPGPIKNNMFASVFRRPCLFVEDTGFGTVRGQKSRLDFAKDNNSSAFPSRVTR